MEDGVAGGVPILVVALDRREPRSGDDEGEGEDVFRARGSISKGDKSLVCMYYKVSFSPKKQVSFSPGLTSVGCVSKFSSTRGRQDCLEDPDKWSTL